MGRQHRERAVPVGHHIASGKPQRNAFVESFNVSLRGLGLLIA